MTGRELIKEIRENDAEDLEIYYLGYVDEEHKITCTDVINVRGQKILSVE